LILSRDGGFTISAS